jgi:hypothetical protein
MRTTLAIDDDVLNAAKAIAELTHKSVGEVVSELARRALAPPAPAAERNGVLLLPQAAPGVIVTPEMVNTLRDEVA